MEKRSNETARSSLVGVEASLCDPKELVLDSFQIRPWNPSSSFNLRFVNDSTFDLFSGILDLFQGMPTEFDTKKPIRLVK